jgi:N-acetylmuramoyl-L-alanine amidase
MNGGQFEMAENCELCEQPILTKVLSGKTIALDVGHGWNTTSLFDAGAVGNNTTEHELNKLTAYRASEILETLGAKVFVFNYENEKERLGLRDKGKRAGGVKADVFVSIHHNAFNGSAQGTEVLVHSDATTEDVKLAKMIHSKLIEHLKLTDRGVKWQKLGVLDGCPASIPACLTEAFFIDSVRFKGSIPDSIIEAEALAIALGIKEFLVGA